MDQSNAEARPRMPELDGLRGLAFLAIAWSHWAPQYQFGLPFGTAVQLFFVISGFLITDILLDYRRACEADPGPRKPAALRVFYARRFLRIFPLYYAVLAAAFLLNVPPIREAWPWHFFYASNFLFAVHEPSARDPFMPFWSLAVEEQFYLVWPFVVLFLPYASLRKAVLAMMVLSPFLRIGAELAFPHWHRVNYLPFSCVDALGAGAWLAFAARHFRRFGSPPEVIARRLALGGLAGGSIVGLAMLLYRNTHWLESLGHTFLVLFYAWIVFRAAGGFGGAVGRVLQWSPIVYLGKISYGLYVFHHFFTFVDFPGLFATLGLPAPRADLFPVRIALQFGLTLAVAAVSWCLFENPLNNLKRHFTLKETEPKAAGARVRDEVNI